MGLFKHIAQHPLRFSISTLKMFCAGHLFMTNVFWIFPAGGPSMLPTLNVGGDYLAVDMTTRRPARPSASGNGLDNGIRIGDLVVFKIPTDDMRVAVKRVIGLPGDYVLLSPKSASLQTGKDRQMIQVPEGHVWLVGDNLTASRDSRSYGPIPLGLVQGRVLAKVLPWRDRKVFGRNDVWPVW